jgi:hypothetical protein
MKTRMTQQIDGYTVIIGIGEAQIDPVATQPRADKELEKTSEYMAVDNLKKSLTPLVQAAQQAFMNARNATTSSEKRSFTKEYQKRHEEIEAIQEQIKAVYPALVEKQRELIVKNAVYFQPATGETIISDDDAEKITTAMQAASEKGNYVDIDLKEIVDRTGVTVWKKTSGTWSQREITVIGDDLKSGESLIIDLTDAQRAEIVAQVEKDRIAKMKASDKKAEKESVLSSAMSAAGRMKSELEVAGDKKALEKSQEWYSTEVKSIELKYA